MDPKKTFEEALKDLKLIPVLKKVGKKLALHLDNPNCPSNWKFLAEKVGLAYLDISSIENRVMFTTHRSCTLFLFEEYVIRRRVTVEQLVTCLRSINNQACIHVLAEAYDKGKICADNGKEQHESMQLVSKTENKPNNEVSPKLLQKVFLTYSNDAKHFVKKIYKWLRCNGCHVSDVSLDMLHKTQIAMDKMAWIDIEYSEADQVLILVTPQYSEDIKRQNCNESALTTLYVHGRMQAEYFQNRCINLRFIPMLLPGSTLDHVPDWLRHRTIVYHWPNHYKAVLSRIFPSKSTKPKVSYTPVVSKSHC